MRPVPLAYRYDKIRFMEKGPRELNIYIVTKTTPSSDNHVQPPERQTDSISVGKKEVETKPPPSFNEEQTAINLTAIVAEINLINQLGRPEVKKANFPIRRWEALREKRGEVYEAGKNLAKNAKSHKPEEDTATDAILLTLRIAENLLIADTFEKQKEIAARYADLHIDQHYEPLEQTSKFNSCGELSIRIAGISFSDIFKKQDLDLSQYLRLAVEATLTKKTLDYDAILSQNNDPISKKYPNTEKNIVNNACKQLDALCSLKPEILSQISGIPIVSGVEREIVSKAEEIANRIFSIKKALFAAVFSPSSPDFPDLSKTLEQYFNEENATLKTIALQEIGFNEPTVGIKAYRKAKMLAMSDNASQSLFYAKLADSIRELVKESPQFSNMLTDGEIATITNDNALTDKAVPSLEDLKDIKIRILQKSSKPEYIIDPSGIDWQRLIKPTGATVKFYKDFPNKISVILDYEGDKGKRLKLALDIDTKNKGELDWNFLESPDDKKMENMRNTTMLSIQSLLTTVLKQAEIEHQEKQKARIIAVSPAPTNTNEAKKNHQDVWVPRIKKRKQYRKPIISPIQEVKQSKVSPAIENTVKKHIFFKRENRDKVMGGISKENQIRIANKMARVNKKGEGEFKAISALHDGKTVFELHVFEYRILATQVDKLRGNGNGIQEYEAFIIDTRQGVFGNTTKAIY